MSHIILGSRMEAVVMVPFLFCSRENLIDKNRSLTIRLKWCQFDDNYWGTIKVGSHGTNTRIDQAREEAKNIAEKIDVLYKSHWCSYCSWQVNIKLAP